MKYTASSHILYHIGGFVAGMPPRQAERKLTAVMEQHKSGGWRISKKSLDQFSEITVADDILVGFNALVSAAHAFMRWPANKTIKHAPGRIPAHRGCL